VYNSSDDIIGQFTVTKPSANASSLQAGGSTN
jgi:hypothetical protein